MLFFVWVGVVVDDLGMGVGGMQCVVDGMCCWVGIEDQDVVVYVCLCIGMCGIDVVYYYGSDGSYCNQCQQVVMVGI